MRGSIAVICIAVLALAAYYYRYTSQAEYRRESLAQVAAAALDIKTSQLKLYSISPGGESIENTFAQIREERERLDKHIANFLKLEERLKQENDGELPGWLKDDRTWQEINRLISGRK